MQCPLCETVAGKGANFCPTCGHQMPVIVGASYHDGIRFPETKGQYYQVAVDKARNAPKYAFIDGRHVCLYERHTVRQLAELYALAYRAFPGDRADLIEHTVNGGEEFFAGRSFWRCFADRLEGVVTSDWRNHPCRCLSYFGCAHAQTRQEDLWHAEGGEVFFHGFHGFFPAREGKLEQLHREYGFLGRADYQRVMDTHRFHMDKAKIQQELMVIVKRAGAHKCPWFSWRTFYGQIKKLPDVVLLDDEPLWRFISDVKRGPGVIFGCYRFAALEAENSHGDDIRCISMAGYGPDSQQ